MDFEGFKCVIEALEVDFSSVRGVGVAVSGGPDSMALCFLLSAWSLQHSIELHVLTVDHGLRDESAQEARQVGEWLDGLGGVQHHVLKWASASQTAVQEEARKARYELMGAYCAAHGLEHLFLGQHMDDQAETVLFRLAKGSGLDGLAGMMPIQDYDARLRIIRPLLSFTKAELVGYCHQQDIDFFEDPSNKNEDFARVRLREAKGVLEKEGLSAKRLSVTAERLHRARKALDIVTNNAYEKAILNIDTRQIVFKLDLLCSEPEEIVLRCVLKAISNFRPHADYAPRMEKVEALVYDLIRSQKRDEAFRKRTLGGVIFEVDAQARTFALWKE